MLIFFAIIQIKNQKLKNASKFDFAVHTVLNGMVRELNARARLKITPATERSTWCSSGRPHIWPCMSYLTLFCLTFVNHARLEKVHKHAKNPNLTKGVFIYANAFFWIIFLNTKIDAIDAKTLKNINSRHLRRITF